MILNYTLNSRRKKKPKDRMLPAKQANVISGDNLGAKVYISATNRIETSGVSNTFILVTQGLHSSY